jgi:hypothetical protein
VYIAQIGCPSIALPVAEGQIEVRQPKQRDEWPKVSVHHNAENDLR